MHMNLIICVIPKAYIKATNNLRLECSLLDQVPKAVGEREVSYTHLLDTNPSISKHKKCTYVAYPVVDQVQNAVDEGGVICAQEGISQSLSKYK